MALMRCAECKAEISDKAATCPQCGNPLAARKAAINPTLVGAIFFTIIGGAAIAYQANQGKLKNPFISESEREARLCTDSEAAYIWLQGEIRDRLRSPSSAVFPPSNDPNVIVSSSTTAHPCDHFILAYYDAQNGFGATIREDIITYVRYEGSGTYSLPDFDEMKAAAGL